MAMIHRTLVTWFLLLVFLIQVGLRLDKRTNWNWFVVLIPAWIYDVFVLIYIGLHCASDIRTVSNNVDLGRFKIKIVFYRLYQATLTLLKVAFLIMLCINLNNTKSRIPVISWYVVFAPILLMMSCLCANTFAILIRPRYRD